MNTLEKTLQDLFQEFLAEYHDYIEMAQAYGVSSDVMQSILNAGYMLYRRK